MKNCVLIYLMIILNFAAGESPPYVTPDDDRKLSHKLNQGVPQIKQKLCMLQPGNEYCTDTTVEGIFDVKIIPHKLANFHGGQHSIGQFNEMNFQQQSGHPRISAVVGTKPYIRHKKLATIHGGKSIIGQFNELNYGHQPEYSKLSSDYEDYDVKSGKRVSYAADYTDIRTTCHRVY